jgi:hypothetical protein
VNGKAPFMVVDFDTQKKEHYQLIKRKVRSECEELLCSNSPKLGLQTIDIDEYFIEDLITYVYQALKGPAHERFNEKLEGSWSEYDMDVRSIPGL